MSSDVFDRAKSIQELEGVDWGEDHFGSSVTRNSHALRRKPITDLTLDDVRLGIDQQIGLRYLVPLALNRLQADLFVEAQYYPGDLLASLLRVPLEFWLAHIEWHNQVETLAQRYFAEWQNQAEVCNEGLGGVRAAYDQFASALPLRRWLRAKGKPPRSWPH